MTITWSHLRGKAGKQDERSPLDTQKHLISHCIRRLHGPLTYLELGKCLDSRSRDNMTSEGRTEGTQCLVKCFRAVPRMQNPVLESQSPRTATLENRDRWRSIWQPLSEISFLVMFQFYLLFIRPYTCMARYILSIFISFVLYIRTSRTCR